MDTLITQIVEKIMEETIKSEENWPESASFLSLDTAIEKKVLSTTKLEIIKFLKNNEVNSVTDLAEKLDKSKGDISKNIKQLEDYGLVRTTKEGRKKVPEINKDHLFIIF